MQYFSFTESKIIYRMFKKITTYLNALFHHADGIQAANKKWYYIFGIVLLLCCGIKLYYGIQNTMDVQYADEAAYLRFGLDLFEKMNRNWGPLYAIWYKCLSYITTDTLHLYYLNFAVTSVLIGIMLYIFLLRISVNVVFALLIAFSVLVCDLNISVWPRISHFCIALCLIALIIISYLKNNIYKCLIFTLLCLINAYARPEFYLSFLLMVFVTLVCIYYNKATISRKDIYIFSVTIILIGILHSIFRFPSNDFFGFNRGVAAFYQHYAWNYKIRTNSSFDAWLYWEDIARKQFGDCNSMWCVLKTQPMIVISNTLFNLKNYCISIVLHIFTYVFPIGIFHWKKVQLLLTVLAISSFTFLIIRKNSRIYFLEKLYSYKFYLLILFCFITPTLLSCAVIMPREHYVFLQILFIILILISAFGYLFELYNFKPLVIILFGILLFFATPRIKNYSFLKVNTTSNLPCNKILIQHLQKTYGNKPHTLFTNMPFASGLLTTNFKEVNTIFDKKKQIPFSHYLDSAKVDIIILTPSTFRDPHIKDDSTWIDFMSNYQKSGFKKDVFSDCETYLLVKQD